MNLIYKMGSFFKQLLWLMLILYVNNLFSQEKIKINQTSAVSISQDNYPFKINKTQQSKWIEFDTLKGLKKDDALKNLGNYFSLNSKNSFELIRRDTDNLGIVHERLKQKYDGIEVYKRQIILHYRLNDNVLLKMNGDILEDVEISIVPKINMQASISKAIELINLPKPAWLDTAVTNFTNNIYSNKEKKDLVPNGNLVIYKNSITGNNHLAWVIKLLDTNESLSRIVVIDASNNDLLSSIPLVTNCYSAEKENSSFSKNLKPEAQPEEALLSCEQGTGLTTWYGNRTIKTTFYSGSGYALYENCGTWGAVATYNQSKPKGYFNATNTWASASTVSGVTSHWAARNALDYYYYAHQRRSYDNNASVIEINNDFNFANASWSGQKLILTMGNNNTSNIKDDWNTIDIIGHEFTHGVTQFSADLDYQKESGALNESFSDIFGEAIENYALGTIDWLHGNDRSTGYNRSFKNPKNKLQPSTYGGQYWESIDGCIPNDNNDQCGVHTNSGVQNYWFYLLANGGSGTNDNGLSYNITGIGFANAAKIAYRNLTVYLSQSSTYEEAWVGSLLSASDLFGDGSSQYLTVIAAWCAVGIGNCSSSLPNLTQQTGSIGVSGSTATFTLTIVNNGTAMAGSFKIGYFASKDATPSSDDILISVDNITSMASNSTKNIVKVIDLCGIQGVSTGSYYLYYSIDYQKIVTELNENDNIWKRTTSVSISCNTQVTLTISPNPLAGGLTTGNGTYTQGQSAIVAAIPNTGWQFTNWTEGGTVVSNNASYTFIINSNRNLVANFTQINTKPNLTVQNGSAIFNLNNNNLNVSLTVINNGGASSGACKVGYYFSINNVAANVLRDYTLGATVVPALPINGTSTQSFTINICDLNTIPIGSYYLFYYIDDEKIVSESDESDNGWFWSSPAIAKNSCIQNYVIAVSNNPINGGTVSGGGSYSSGQSAIVTATANAGWQFTNWTEGGNVVSSSASYTFTVSGNRTLVANFTQQSYNVSVSANPTNGGSVSGGSTYSSGQSVTVTATANAGWQFTNWTEGGNVASSSSSYTFTVSGNRILVANFTQQSYNVLVSANPTNGGTVLGGSTYSSGQSVTVAATANNGWQFTNWTEGGNVVSSSSSYTFTVSVNRTLVANFTQQSYNVSVSANPTNGGSVSGGNTYFSGQSAIVVATANNGWQFTNWTEGGNVVSSNASYTFAVISNRTLVANFTQQSYNISISANPPNGGSVSGGSTYSSGQSATVGATANAGWQFTNWTEGGNEVSSSASYTFAVSSNRTLVANFTQQSYNVSVSANPTNGGTVSGGSTYSSGQNATVGATANAGWQFTNWTEGNNVVSSSASYTFTVSGNRTLVANFTQQSYNVSVSANPTNGGSVSGGSTYSSGQSATVGATANAGWQFTNWTEGGNVVSSNASYTFAVSSNRTLVANFTQQSYNVLVSANPTNGGSVSGGNTYSSGQSVTVAATANNGWQFTNWTEGGNVISSSTSYTFAVSGNRTLVANFTQQSYNVSVSANPTNGGSVSGGSTYSSGQSATVTATANNGWQFTNWTEAGIIVSTNTNYVFTVNTNRTLVANFTQQTFSIAVAISPLNCGAVSGVGTYFSGVEAKLTATPTSNCRFENWTEGGVILETNPVFRFPVSSNKILSANFTVLSDIHDLSVENVKVYPNPNNGQFEITFSAPTIEAYQFTINNLLGQSIKTGFIESGTTTKGIEFLDEPKGLYILQLYNSEQKHINIKLLIE